jgi:DNA repair exonuclease SbcCD ATPase subunit
LQKNIVVVDRTANEIQETISSLQVDISKVQEDKKLSEELEILNHMYSNYVVSAIQLNEKKEIESKIEQLRSDYITVSADKKNKEELLENTPDVVTCNLCNGVSDNKAKKEGIKSEIEGLSKKLEEVKEEGVKVKESLTKLTDKIKEDEIEYKKKLTNEISSLKTKISDNKQEKINVIKDEILNHQKDLNNISSNEKTEARINILKSEINSLKTRNSELQERLKNIGLFTNDLKANEELNQNIKINEDKIESLQKLINQNDANIFINNEQINRNLTLTTFFTVNEERINEELKKDKIFKTYVDVHSKGGLAMKILGDLAEDINQDLKAVLAEDDFSPSIKIENDAIEFYFERNGLEFNMAEGSGYEKTVLLLALHYLLLSKMVVPISNIFILDEVFVAVSSPFLPRVYKVVEKLLNIFETVALITHNEEVAEWCNDNIKIVKNNNISKIVG